MVLVESFQTCLIVLTFRGTLQFKNISYGIEPMETVSGFVHIIYEEENDNPNIPLLGDNDTYSHNNLQYQDIKSSELMPLCKMCRKSFDEDCDFPEYCSGVSSYCVPDTHACNGQTCDSGDSFCYMG
ncbi:Disintegrin And Metalloproteinase Domain-Containing Protein 5-Like [Manis pentadactyla]|nr:Disintegrin And Metalloproteinase Domain-Containing Protein 5-Like [Manis pentadactyla]